MPYPTLTFPQMLDNATRQELDQFISLLQGYLSAEHKDDGTHSAVTADSVDVDEDVTVGGDLEVDGSITADADGTPMVLAPDATFGPGLRLTNGTSASWRIEASADSALPQILIRDLLQAASTGDTGTIKIIRTVSGVSSTYVIRPHASYITLHLGSNASGQRIAEVNASLVRTLTGYYERARSYALGERQTYSFVAGDFTADTGSWTVASGDVSGTAKGISWTKDGLRMSADLMIATTTTAGTPGYLKFTLPGGSTIDGDVAVPCNVFHAGTWQTGYLQAVSGETFLRIYATLASAAWPNETDTIWVRGQIAFFVTT